MYHEFATDPKVQMLSEADQRRFIMLLCLRCCNGSVTLRDEEVAFQLRISIDEWHITKTILLGKELVKDDNAPSAWDKRQYVSDSSAERVAKHRASKKTSSNVTVTAPDPETEGDTEIEKTPIQPSEKKTPKGVQGGVVDKTVGYDVGKHLSDDGWAAARRAAEGWDIHRLVQVYNGGITKRGVPRNADAAFPAWCASYTKGRPPA
jgi:hypothetical protein